MIQGAYYTMNTKTVTKKHLHFQLHNEEWNFEKTNATIPFPYLVW